MTYVFNPFIRNLDDIGVSSGGTAAIPEVTSDPASPTAGDAWMLRSLAGASSGGDPVGLLLALTTPASSGSNIYQLSYYTAAGAIVRTVLT